MSSVYSFGGGPGPPDVRHPGTSVLDRALEVGAAVDETVKQRRPLPRQLVVNADDFGISRGVNRGIVEAHRRGIVTSASVMANLPSAEDALTRAAVCPDLGLGLHLTLTAGRPLCPAELVPSLVDGTGAFYVLGELLGRLSAGRVRRLDLERELGAQLAWALRRGLRPTHLDAHHHVHVHPRVAPVVLDLAREHGVRWVRCPVETVPPRLLRTAPRDLGRMLAISLFAILLRERARRAGLWTARHFRGIALGMGFGTEALAAVPRSLPPGLTELMTHPGEPDEELARLTDFVEGRDRELAALTSRAAWDALARWRVRVTSFQNADPAGAYT